MQQLVSPESESPLGEKTIKQLDPCHKSEKGEMQGSQADTEHRPGCGSDGNINPEVIRNINRYTQLFLLICLSIIK